MLLDGDSTISRGSLSNSLSLRREMKRESRFARCWTENVRFNENISFEGFLSRLENFVFEKRCPKDDSHCRQTDSPRFNENISPNWQTLRRHISLYTRESRYFVRTKLPNKLLKAAPYS